MDTFKLQELDENEEPEDDAAKQKPPTWCQHLDDLIETSSIHGLTHLASVRKQSNHQHHVARPIAERIFWLVAMFASAVCFIVFAEHLVRRCERSPLSVGLAERSQPIWDIPFPAVTICPETKAKSEFVNFTQAYHVLMETAEGLPFNMTHETLQRVEALALLCDAHLTENLQLGQSIVNRTLMQALREMAPTLNEVLFFCKLRSDAVPCTHFFNEIWTDEGLCFTFNMLNSTDLYHEKGVHLNVPTIMHNESATSWSTESGYAMSPNVSSTFPYRAHSAGHKGGLFVLLRLYAHDYDYLCRGPVMGFKVLLHAPDEMPQMSNHYFKVPLNQETIVKVTPRVVVSTEQVRNYSPTRRQCYFSGEKRLRYFKVYTQRNCELECLSARLIEKCNCTHFSYPKDNGVSTCGSASISCTTTATRDLLDQNQMDGLTDARTDCDCLPSCASITYDADVQHVLFDWKKLFVAFKSPLDEFPGMEAGRLSVMFKDSHFTATKRYELYNYTELLALIGGLLALFFGASLLSLLEIVYHILVKVAKRTLRRTHHSQGLKSVPCDN